MLHYTITPLPKQHLFRVCLHFSHHSSQPVRLTLPNWVPGSYMIREFARHIVRIEASCNGQAADLQAVSKNIWQAEKNTHGDWLIEYDVYAFDLSVRGCYLDSERAFFDGAALFFQDGRVGGDAFEDAQRLVAGNGGRIGAVEVHDEAPVRGGGGIIQSRVFSPPVTLTPVAKSVC